MVDWFATESAFQVFRRLKRKHYPNCSFLTPVIGDCDLRAGDLLEVSGCTKSGKSQLLYDCVANYILFKLKNEEDLRNLNLVWINLDWNVDQNRVETLVWRKLGIIDIEECPVSLRTKLEDMFSCIQLCFPQDDWQFLLYLHQLQQKIETVGKSYLILIDGIGNFHYWNLLMSQLSIQQTCFKKLKSILTELPVVCLACVKPLNPFADRSKYVSTDQNAARLHQEYLPLPWKHLVRKKFQIYPMNAFQEAYSSTTNSSSSLIIRFDKPPTAENSICSEWKIFKQWIMRITNWEVYFEETNLYI
eukprot:jgi/Galph1/2911/GphlegSOOS_G1562.1